MRNLLRVLIRGYQITISPILSLLGGEGRWLPIFPDVLGILFAGRRTARRAMGKLSRTETVAALSSVGRQRI
jgi:hypothetical protein